MNSTIRHLRASLSRLTDRASGETGEDADFAPLKDMSPQETINRLTDRMIPAIALHDNLHKRFRQLETAWQHAERALPPIQQQILDAPLPLTRHVATQALRADNLMKSLARQFAQVARDIRDDHQEGALGKLRNKALGRAVQVLDRRHLLASLACSVPSYNSWLLLHELWQTRDANDAESLAMLRDHYIGALLYNWLEPNRIPRSDLPQVWQIAHQLAPLASISEFEPDEIAVNAHRCAFLVYPDDGRPGQSVLRLRDQLPVFGGLLINCDAIVEQLEARLQAPAGSRDAAAWPAKLVRSMHSTLGGQRTRQHARQRVRPRAELIGGLPRVTRFLDDLALSRREGDELKRQEELDPPPSEWSIVDESPAGFRLRYARGEQWGVGVGDLVAMQPREGSQVHVCLVGRIMAVDSQLEIGLRLLSPQVSTVDIEIDGYTSGRAVLLHSLPAHDRVPGIVLPPGTARSGRRIGIRLNGRLLEKKLGACIEANDGLEFFALDPVPI